MGDDSFESSLFCVVMRRWFGNREWGVFWDYFGAFVVAVVVYI